MYTTIPQVRELSGLDDTANVPPSVVSGKIQIAGSMLDSSVAERYQLPLSFHKQNSITFTGAGTGSDTMTITINAVNYDIAITTGLTPEQAADLFRLAAETSVDFITDNVSGSPTVIIISKAANDDLPMANAQVTIGSAGGTVQGITGTGATITPRYTPIVEQIVAEIAASLLLMDNYGIEAEDTPKDGEARMDRINDLLQKLQGVHDSGQIIRLFDEVTNDELVSSSISLPSFFPDNASAADASDPTGPKVGINQVF